MVKEFEDAVRLLTISEITKQPVETAFGFHIVRRDPLE